jgi:hypothetical protein
MKEKMSGAIQMEIVGILIKAEGGWHYGSNKERVFTGILCWSEYS